MQTKISSKLSCLLIIIFLFGLTGCGNDNTVIGEVYGPEHEYIKIGEDTYTVYENPGVTKNDQAFT